MTLINRLNIIANPSSRKLSVTPSEGTHCATNSRAMPDATVSTCSMYHTETASAVSAAHIEATAAVAVDPTRPGEFVSEVSVTNDPACSAIACWPGDVRPNHTALKCYIALTADHGTRAIRDVPEMQPAAKAGSDQCAS